MVSGTTIAVAIEGTDLPGPRCRPNPSGREYGNVQVALCKRGTSGSHAKLPGHSYGVVQLVPGDAATARFELEVTVRADDEGLDFGGPWVLGRRSDRHLGLAWGDVKADGSFGLFRAAKLRLDRIDPDVIREAAAPDSVLIGRVGLTDEKGNPRCATVLPPHIRWSAHRT